MGGETRPFYEMSGGRDTISVRDDGQGYRLIGIVNDGREAICIVPPDECRKLIAVLYPAIAELLDRFDDRELRKMGEG